MTWSPVSYGLCAGGKAEDNQELVTKLYMKVKMKHLLAPCGVRVNAHLFIHSQSAKYLNRGCMDTINVSSAASDMHNEPAAKIKDLSRLAEKNHCTLTQLMVAWCLKNQTSQVHFISASSVSQFNDILASLQVFFFASHYNFLSSSSAEFFSFFSSMLPSSVLLPTRWSRS